MRFAPKSWAPIRITADQAAGAVGPEIAHGLTGRDGPLHAIQPEGPGGVVFIIGDQTHRNFGTRAEQTPTDVVAVRVFHMQQLAWFGFAGCDVITIYPRVPVEHPTPTFAGEDYIPHNSCLEI